MQALDHTDRLVKFFQMRMVHLKALTQTIHIQSVEAFITRKKKIPNPHMMI